MRNTYNEKMRTKISTENLQNISTLREKIYKYLEIEANVTKETEIGK